jgi:hypothetical protein
MAREIGNRYHEMLTLINLSSVAGNQHEGALALQYARQAAELARAISEQAGEAWAMLYMGHASLLNGDLQLAHKSYRKSLEIRNYLSQPALSMEPIAGLVEAYLREDDLESSSREAEKILRYLGNGSSLEGTEEPLRVYYACYLFLEKKQDPRSRWILQSAMSLLEAQVSKFSDDSARKRYIENIPWRRAIWDAAKTSLG